MIRKVFFVFCAFAAVLGNPVPEDIESHIVGGTNARIEDFPWQVSLRTTVNFHFCGGSIISSSWIVTAAHCVFGRAGNSILVVISTSFLNSGGFSHRSNRIINHSNYNSTSLAFDISVVEVAQPITFTSTARAIPMNSNIIGGGQSAIITGWGGTSQSGGPSPNQLQRLTTNTLTLTECRNRHLISYEPFIFDHKICTLTRSGEGVCQGDSGGGLVLNNQLIGLASWNIPCARGWPDVYDRISSHRAWIRQNTGV